MPNPGLDAGQNRCRTVTMQDKSDAIQDGCMTGQMQDKSDVRQDGCRNIHLTVVLKWPAIFCNNKNYLHCDKMY